MSDYEIDRAFFEKMKTTYEGLWRNKDDDTLMTIVDWEHSGYHA